MPTVCLAKRTYPQVLRGLRWQCQLSVSRAPARPDVVNPRTRTLVTRLSGRLYDIGCGTAARASAKKLEVASINSAADRISAIQHLSASRLAGKVVGSISTMSTKSTNCLQPWAQKLVKQFRL